MGIVPKFLNPFFASSEHVKSVQNIVIRNLRFTLCMSLILLRKSADLTLLKKQDLAI